MLARLIRVRTLVILVLIASFVVAGLTVLKISKPTITITVIGEHNPITDFVYLNNKPTLPTGAGGKTYKTKGKVGKNIIRIDGPYVNSTDIEVEAGFFGSADAEIKSDLQENETIIRQTLNEPKATIFGLRTYPDSNTMVFGLSGDLRETVEGDEGFGVILHYDILGRKWTDVTEAATEDFKNYQGSEKARTYLYELTED